MKKSTALLLGLILLIFLLPVLLIFALSFLNPGDCLALTFAQYQGVLADKDLLRRFGNSARITLGTLLIQLPLSMLGGLVLSRQHGYARNIVAGALLLMLLLPFQSYMMPVFKLCKEHGLYDTLWAPILLYAFSPLGSLIMFAFVRMIPEEQWEAAALETSSLIRTSLTVVLPQLLPALVILLLLAFAEAWNMVEPALILLKDDWYQPASVSLNNFQSIPYAGAALYCVPVLMLYGLVAMVLARPRQHENLHSQ